MNGGLNEGELRLSVLGPLQVTFDGCTVEIRSKMQVRLLAALTSRANNSVPTPRLIGALWPEPPDAAAENLRQYVMAVRKVVGRDRIVRERQGYRLVLHDDENDAHRFQAMVDEANRTLGNGLDGGDGHVAHVDDLLTQALNLWRGPAYEDVTNIDLVRPEADRLNEVRIAALEQRADARLSLGRHETMIPELAELMAAHLSRERPRRLWMLALYRSGRQTDALAAYQQWRRHLDEEFGLEPGPDIMRLQQAILNHDPSLVWKGHSARPTPPARTARTTAPPRTPVPTPAELPFDGSTTFTGRTAEVDRLRDRLTRDSISPVVISATYGAGGIGKSALAMHVGHQIAEQFPDGQLYVNLHGSTPNMSPLSPAEALPRLMRSLGTGEVAIPDEVDELSARFRSLTNGKRLLLVLDNALDEAQVRPLLPASPKSRVVITSRRALTDLDGAHHERLDLLPDDEALALLARLVGTERIEAEPDAAREIVAHCGGLPLAICVTAARLRARPSRTIQKSARRLRQEASRLAEMETADRGLRATFAVSYQALDTELRRCFRLMSLLDTGDLSMSAVAAVIDRSEDRTEEILEQLVEAQLVENHLPGRYGQHDLLRLFARERTTEEDNGERAYAIQRGLHWYLATARAAARALFPPSRTAWLTGLEPHDLTADGLALKDRKTIFAWIDTDSDSLPAVMQQSMNSMPDGPVLAAAQAAALQVPLWYRGRFKTMQNIGELAVEAAAASGKPLHHAIAYDMLGAAQVQIGNLSDAVSTVKTCLAAYREVGYRPGEAYQLGRLAFVYSKMGGHDEAIEGFRQAIDISRTCGHRWSELINLSEFGIALQRIGRLEDALDAHTKALQISKELGIAQSDANGMTAEVHRLLGRHDEAIKQFKQTIADDEMSGDTGTYAYAESWWKLGEAHHDARDPDRARECWQRSAAIMYELNLITSDEKHTIDISERPETPEVVRRNT